MPETVWDWLAGAWINLGLVDYFHDYIGYLHGEPVATASIMYGDGVAGLYNVATLPEARGKGIEAMISYVPFNDAEKNGYRYGILHASSMGYPVYKRLGFQDICKLIRYTWDPEV
jgi:GNAT superfamily N-acetyltransferase